MDERQPLPLRGLSADCSGGSRCSEEGRARMNNFSYARPQSAPEAVKLGGVDSTMFLAGGTELLNWMRLGISAPAQVVDIGLVAEMRGIRKEGNNLWIGALTTLAQIEANPLVRKEAPVLAE